MTVKGLKTLVSTGEPFAEEGLLVRFREVYERNQTYVRRVLFRMNGRDAVDDLVQEVFEKVWRNLGRFRGDSSERTWIYRIAVRTACDHLRREKKRFAEGGDPDTQAAAPENREMRELIRLGIERLPPKQRAVFVLHYYEGLSVEEIGGALGVRKGTVKSRLHYAREAFEKFLDGNGVKP